MPWDPGVYDHAAAGAGQAGLLCELRRGRRAARGKVVNAGGGTVHDTFFYPAVLYPVNCSGCGSTTRSSSAR